MKFYRVFETGTNKTIAHYESLYDAEQCCLQGEFLEIEEQWLKLKAN